MSITIDAVDKQEYLLIQPKGQARSRDELMQYCHRIQEEILKHDCDRILINEPTTHFSLEITDYFELIKNYVENSPPEVRALKIAAVVAPAYKQVADTWESLCESHGFRYYTFTDFDDARMWLLEDDE